MTWDRFGYDEPGSRTRQAWLRTWLATLAVSALMLRGLAVTGAGWLPAVVVLAGLVALGGIAMSRSARLGPRHSPAPSRRLLPGAAGVVIALAILAAAYLLLQGQST